MADPRAKAFFDTLIDRMKKDGFEFVRQDYSINQDALVFMFKKPGNPASVVVPVSGLDLMRMTDAADLANTLAEQAIKTYPGQNCYLIPPK